MTSVLSQELKTYEQHRERLLSEHEDKWVLIHGDQILGTYHAEMDAIEAGYQQLGVVPFLVKKIERFERPATFGASLLGI